MSQPAVFASGRILRRFHKPVARFLVSDEALPAIQPAGEACSDTACCEMGVFLGTVNLFDLEYSAVRPNHALRELNTGIKALTDDIDPIALEEGRLPLLVQGPWHQLKRFLVEFQTEIFAQIHRHFLTVFIAALDQPEKLQRIKPVEEGHGSQDTIKLFFVRKRPAHLEADQIFNAHAHEGGSDTQRIACVDSLMPEDRAERFAEINCYRAFMNMNVDAQ